MSEQNSKETFFTRYFQWTTFAIVAGVLGGVGSFLSFLNKYKIDLWAIWIGLGILVVGSILIFIKQFLGFQDEIKKKDQLLDFKTRELATLTEIYSPEQHKKIEEWSNYFRDLDSDDPPKYQYHLREKLHDLYPNLFSATSPPD